MKRCWYDRECTKEIKAHFDPCYRTGEFYSRNSLCAFKGGDYVDSLEAVVNRCTERDTPIWFITDKGQKVRLTFKGIHTYKTADTGITLILFEDSKGKSCIFNYAGYNTLLKVSNTNKFNVENKECDLEEIYKLCFYSFVENLEDMDKDINPLNYKDCEPMTDEELEIVRIRSTTDPYYITDSYKKEIMK